MAVSRHHDLKGPGAAARARLEVHRLAGDALRAGRPLPPATENAAVLVVSELVTNAIRYADGECTLDLALEGDGIGIDVHDHNPDPPRPKAPDPGREGGFGLGIVSRLVDSLTVRSEPDGKTVHAHVDR
ncbi:ATP-binding protein [Streptomyces sp. NPDC058326]|uniref:ATP-binding protein n=1 Tax=Streptomyces sp. NPDC058326 TaxID=3346447 RepID=UPI0036E39AA7